MKAIAADIDRDNFRVFLSELDIDRTIRVYKALAKLSEEAVTTLNSGMLREFSVFTDRMRPLLLLYLVDPAATQDSKGVQRVFTKGLKVPVPIFGICLPPPDPSQGGVEAAARE